MQNATQGQDIKIRLDERVLATESLPFQPSMTSEYTPPNSIPTMLFQRELNYLKWSASQVQGRGRVIDLGCFLGGSTSALLSGLGTSQSVISYDSFETPESNYPLLIKLLDQFGLQPGSCFLRQFKECTRAWEGRIEIRDGWLPEFTTRNKDLKIYPERDPVELLFCDIAKTWGVHLAVLHAFGPHLLERATVIQQDFFDIQTPWIPIHMWQLRDRLFPLDVIHGTSTASFLCSGPLSEQLDMLWREDHDQLEIERSWDLIIAYWGKIIGDDAAQVFHGHAFQLAVMQGRPDDAAEHGRAYEKWCRTSQSLDRYVSPSWPDLLEYASSTLPSHLDRPHGIDRLAAESTARGMHTNHIHSSKYSMYCPIPNRISVWSRVLEECSSSSTTNVLYGAGMHTKWLLEHFENTAKAFDLIIDDQPSTDSIAGIPVMQPSRLESNGNNPIRIYPSSDVYEAQMVASLQKIFKTRPEFKVQRVYTNHQNAELVQPKSEYVVEAKPLNTSRIASQERDSYPTCFPSVAEHRQAMHLEPARDWILELERTYHAPSWCTGHLQASDCAFVWDLIESIRPNVTVEIGTAGGVSTASMLHAIDLLCDKDSLLYTFDIATRCYFDESRRLASVVGEAAPSLIPRLRSFSGSSATDGSGLFSPGEIDLLLIDAEHAHPSPVVDLISLAYVIRPLAWIILHDIELQNFDHLEPDGTQNVSGPGRLYQSWPFEKLQPRSDDPECRNIGAIRFPDDPAKAIRVLLDMLTPPWESSSHSVSQAQRAHAILSPAATLS